MKGGSRMDITKVIKQLLLEDETTYKEVAEKLGIQEQSLRNKISRKSFTLSSLEELLNAFNCDLIVRKRDSKKEFY